MSVSVTTLAVAWSKQHDFVASTIVGATSLEQMDDIIEATDLILDEQTMKQIHKISREIRYPLG